MENESTESQFPKTAKDVDNLKQTAGEAASNLGEVATKHASKAKEQIKDLAGHTQEEGQQQLEKVKGSFDDVAATARNYFVERPFTCLGVAFVLGAFFARARSVRD